ncbi:hypothetical protein BU25DRAFT_408393 [Macroventuria anomochaeta]|uniref:Uncharacterized protein n=1 Tax=Macroventuria anomochaeta TaxID=301207 RepID=A0ACB6S8T4_9PLEO|nr:uncharacterized protein BU25DRAFT_408393 [Macroventuria anomochaeta]KAF2630453.1 hypothetical protein BU25DRAFT_408393 [Macroventuria anomochaeta]
MSLKHLLNDEDIESYPVYAQQLRWGDTDDLGFFDEPVPVLPCQPWDQCIGEILAPDVLDGSYGANIDPTLESFQFTQHHIEQWVTGHVVPEVLEAPQPPKEDLVCYGTVSLLR